MEPRIFSKPNSAWQCPPTAKLCRLTRPVPSLGIYGFHPFRHLQRPFSSPEAKNAPQRDWGEETHVVNRNKKIYSIYYNIYTLYTLNHFSWIWIVLSFECPQQQIIDAMGQGVPFILSFATFVCTSTVRTPELKHCGTARANVAL